MMVSQTMAPAPRPAPKARETRNWWVQVGEFRSQHQAKAEIEHVARKFAHVFNNAEGSVDSTGRTYRARFGGFTENTAKEACSAVRARGGACAVGGPA
jgi:D-alanyl-D-alanine carboxypeptidase (penicillin-binding protein 5/6)